MLQDLCSMEQDLKDSEPSERPNSYDSAFQSLSNLEEQNNNMSRKVVSPAMVRKSLNVLLQVPAVHLFITKYNKYLIIPYYTLNTSIIKL